MDDDFSANTSSFCVTSEAPMVEYRDMLRNLLTVAAKYVEIEDAYPEPRPERSRD